MSETFEMKVDNDEVTISLLPILDMSAAEEFLATVRKALNESKNLTLDAGEVERVSTPCVQVILAASNAVEKMDGAFKINNVTADLQRGMDDLGLTENLKNWRIEE